MRQSTSNEGETKDREKRRNGLAGQIYRPMAAYELYSVYGQNPNTRPNFLKKSVQHCNSSNSECLSIPFTSSLFRFAFPPTMVTEKDKESDSQAKMPFPSIFRKHSFSLFSQLPVYCKKLFHHLDFYHFTVHHQPFYKKEVLDCAI